MSNSVRPHRRQPNRLPRPWDSPGKNSGVGCHFLLQCMTVKSESEVAQSCPTLSDPVDCSPPGSSIHGIFPGKSTTVGCHCLLQGSHYSVIKRNKLLILAMVLMDLKGIMLTEKRKLVLECYILYGTIYIIFSE